MSDQPDVTGAEENFAEMLDAFSPGKRSEVRVGDRVKGRVISIGKDTVFVDAGMKIDAVVERGELLDAEQNLACSVGDELELYVAAVSENEVRLSRAISGAGGAQMLRDAHQGGVPVEGKVKEVCKGGYSVEVLHRRAFCPQSQIDLVPAADPAAHVGATYQFLVTRFEEKGRNIVVSRRALLSRELEVLRRQFMETLKAGQVLDGTVSRIMPFISNLVMKHSAPYLYLPRSIEAFYQPPEFQSVVARNGFADVAVDSLTLGIATVYRATRQA